MKTVVIMTAMALASSLAVAQKSDQVQNRSEAPHNATMPGPAGDYWSEHAKSGYMSRDQAMDYKSKDGRTMEWEKMDANSDGRVSEVEWRKYHGDMVQNRSEAPANPTMPATPPTSPAAKN